MSASASPCRSTWRERRWSRSCAAAALRAAASRSSRRWGRTDPPKRRPAPPRRWLSAATGVARFIQKLFRRDQIGGVETLRKAVVDGPQAGDGIGGSTLIAQQPGEARRGTQLAGQRLLPPRPVQRLPEEVLRHFANVRVALQQQKLALEA